MKIIELSAQTTLEQFTAQLRKNTDQSKGEDYRIMIDSEPQMFYGAIREDEFKIIPIINKVFIPRIGSVIENAEVEKNISVSPLNSPTFQGSADF